MNNLISISNRLKISRNCLLMDLIRKKFKSFVMAKLSFCKIVRGIIEIVVDFIMVVKYSIDLKDIAIQLFDSKPFKIISAEITTLYTIY